MTTQPSKGHFVQATMIVIVASQRPIRPLGLTDLMGPMRAVA
ncbi:hypothetical protein [Thalassospira sp.]